MNARKILRMLRRNRFEYLFGKRMALTFVVPPNVFPEPPPGVPEALVSTGIDGEYAVDGKIVQFHTIYTGDTEAKAISWCTAEYEPLDGYQHPEEREWEAAYYAHRAWEWDYLYAAKDLGTKENEAYNRMLNNSKTVCLAVRPNGDYELTFIVKATYPRRQRRVASGARAWMKHLKKRGIRVRYR